jgi:galactose-1-phosphate uridylyltransferase
MTREEQVKLLDDAIKNCKIAQFAPKDHKHDVDPITGQEIIVNTARSKRHFETKKDSLKEGITPISECMYCRYETTPTLFYVNLKGEIVFPNNDDVVKKIEEYLDEKILVHEDAKSDANTYYSLVKDNAIVSLNKEQINKEQIKEDWICRVFLNLTPAIHERNGKGNCFLISGSSNWHDKDLSELPITGIKACIEAWKLLAAWSKKNNLVFTPFYNGGKSIASGQSVDCFHFQVYAQPEMPSIYKRISERNHSQGCGVCKILKEEEKKILKVSEQGPFMIYVHPYPPKHNFTWLVAKKDCGSNECFEETDSLELAKAIKKAASLYPLLFGSIPAYNMLVRLSEYTGHFHIIFVPRTNTNIPAGFEYTTDMTVITEDCEKISKAIKEKLELTRRIN